VIIISLLIFCAVLPSYIYEDLGEIFLCLLFFSFAAVNQAFFVTTFFSNAKLAVDIYTFIITCASILYYAIFYVHQLREKAWVLYLFSLLP